MPVAETKTTSRLFHATVQVTRIEEWCVEAESAAEAHRLLARGDGERCHVGECLHLEVTRIEDA